MLFPSNSRVSRAIASRTGSGTRPIARNRVRTYPSDMTDEEWAVVRDALPTPAWLEGRGGQPEGYCHRQMLDAIRYVTDNGIKWRAMPADFPAWDQVYAFFAGGARTELAQEFHDRLRSHRGRLVPVAGLRLAALFGPRRGGGLGVERVDRRIRTNRRSIADAPLAQALAEVGVLPVAGIGHHRRHHSHPASSSKMSRARHRFSRCPTSGGSPVFYRRPASCAHSSGTNNCH